MNEIRTHCYQRFIIPEMRKPEVDGVKLIVGVFRSTNKVLLFPVHQLRQLLYQYLSAKIIYFQKTYLASHTIESIIEFCILHSKNSSQQWYNQACHYKKPLSHEVKIYSGKSLGFHNKLLNTFIDSKYVQLVAEMIGKTFNTAHSQQ